MMATIRELLQELDHESSATRRTLERVPESKLDWKPHEKSMTLGVLAMHVATIPEALAEISMRPSFDAGFVVPRPTTASIAALLEAHDRSVARAKDILASMDDAALDLPWRMVNQGVEIASMPRGIFLRSVLFNHWYHHRGQLTVYLREAGALVPSIYGASADEQPGQR
jgi:uncharacterized damage-inducible protein DinB